MKTDLHYHGPIGFQDYLLKVQGYKGKNLLEEIARNCFRREIEVCAIVSDEDEIPLHSIHDRFNWLKNNYSNSLSSEYVFDILGINVGIITRREDDKKIYLLNGQTVRTGHGDPLTKQGGIDYLVVGANDIPNHKPLGDTVKYVYDRGLIGIAEHPYCTAHGGMGQENLEKLLPYIDCIKGHNSQLRWKVPSFLPMLGNFRKYLNNLAQQFAEEHNKPWIANSDGHRIEDVGISYIDINSDSVKIDSEKRFLSSLRLAILCNEFSQHCSYENQFTWLNWVSKLIIGIKSGKDKK